LEQYGQWPFPRDVYGKIIKDLYDRGAGLVVFNVLMPETDRSGKDLILAETMRKLSCGVEQCASTTDQE
jgi:CHASE2 domain-containing sensor protein